MAKISKVETQLGCGCGTKLTLNTDIPEGTHFERIPELIIADGKTKGWKVNLNGAFDDCDRCHRERHRGTLHQTMR